MATWAPSAMKRRAVARPMPLLPPVMRAFLPASFILPPPDEYKYGDRHTCDDPSLNKTGRIFLCLREPACRPGSWSDLFGTKMFRCTVVSPADLSPGVEFRWP